MKNQTEKITDHGGKDKQSHLLKYALRRRHQHIDFGSI